MPAFSATARPLNSTQPFVTILHNASSLANARRAFGALYELHTPVRKSSTVISGAISVESAYPELF